MDSKTFFKTTEKVEVNNYPYGYLKTTAFFSLEHKPGKGFRTVFQTINPKTGKLNKVKNSTYSPVMVMYKEETTGHIKYYSFRFYDNNDKIKDCKFMYEHFDLFTPEQIKDIAGYLLMVLKVDIKAKHIYCGADVNKMLPLYDEAMKTVVKIYKTGENLFNQIHIDFEAVEKLQIPDFNPFRKVEYKDVLENGLNNPVVTQISDHDKNAGETIESIQAEENVKVLIHKTLDY
jgi:hypothetical protein